MSASLANGIQSSANDLITSEANYDGLFDSLHSALSSLPAKLNNIGSLLNDYRAIVSNVPDDNSFRQSADRLYTIINGIYTDASSQALTAMEVGYLMEELLLLLLYYIYDQKYFDFCSQYL